MKRRNRIPARSDADHPDAMNGTERKHLLRQQLSRGRKIAFTIAAISLPILLFAVIELVLRICGFGGHPPTIQEIGPVAGGTLCITDNPGPASYFFANPDKPGSLNPACFLKPKPEGVVRILIAGESAAKGFPQPTCLTISAFLEAMLSDAWPDRTVEVINLGTTAVASFPVLEMLTEALACEPDLVIIHCGNNEFFGAYGVASLHAAGRTPTAIRLHRMLRGLAIVQWVGGLARSADADAAQKTLMEVMIGQSYTGPDDPLRSAAAANLKTHISEMIARCSAMGVPVVVCTLPGNERDLAPLGEDDLSMLSAEDYKKLADLLAAGESRLKSAPADAAADFEAVLALQPSHARAHYLHGRAQFATDRFVEAAASFSRSIDLDPMPWRCPESSQEAIRGAASEGGAIVCDLREAFRKASPGGCIGLELMDDHVHPTLMGQALSARAIVMSLAKLSGPVSVSEQGLSRLKSDEDYARRLGDNPYDRYGVAHTMRVLSNIPFFRKTNPSAYERFDRLCRDFERSQPAEIVEVCRKWQSPAMHPGAKRPITGMVGRVLIRLNRMSDAERLYDIARRSVSLYSSWNLEYNYFMLVCRERVNGKLDDADRALAAECIERGKFLLDHGHSESGMAERYTGRLHQLREEWAAAIPFLMASRSKVGGTDLVAVDQALVMSYMRTGRKDDAMKLIQNGIQHSGEFAGLYRQMLPAVEQSSAPNQASPP